MALDPIEARHEAVLTKLIEAAEADERIVAAWLQGSRADGTADPFSDIDFYIALSDEAYLSFDGLDFIERAAHVLVHADLPANFGVVCLLEGPVKLDLVVEQTSGVGKMIRPAVKMLVDKDGVESKLVTAGRQHERMLQEELTNSCERRFKAHPGRFACCGVGNG